MSEQQPSEIVVVGAAALDIKGRLRDQMVAQTSNPGTVTISIGGVGRNIAENLVRLGISTALISAVGDDAFGEAIVRRTSAAGVDTSGVITIRDHSAAYLALLEHQGNLVVAVDDTHCAELISDEDIDQHAAQLRAARMAVIDANLAMPTVERLLAICHAAGVPVCLEPVSYSLAARFKDLLGSFFLVTPNAIEAQALTGIPVRTIADATSAAQQLVSAGVEIAIVTLNREGLVYATGDQHGSIPAIACEIVDPTGAGDALAAAVIYGLLQRLPVDEAVRLGVSAATLTLLSSETVSRELTLESLYGRLVI